MKLKVTRTITFSTEADMSCYPGMTRDEAVAYEKGLELADFVDALEFSEDVNSSVEVEVID